MKKGVLIVQKIILGLLFIHQAHAGPSSSGGGMGVLCSSNGTQQLQTLDLYEAFFSKTPLIKSTGTLLGDYSIGLQRIRTLTGDTRPVGQTDLTQLSDMLKRSILLTDAPLPMKNDVGETPALPNGCRYQQIALYNDDTQKLLLNRKLWSELDSLNQAALILHEVIYKLQRIAFYSSSQQTRFFIREILSASGPNLEGTYDGLQKGKALICFTGDSSTSSDLTFAWQDKQIQLLTLAGEVRLAQTTVATPVSIEDIKLIPTIIGTSEVGVLVTSTPQNFNVIDQNFTSQLPIPHITWRQSVAAGKPFQVGVNVRGVEHMYFVRSCTLYQ